jgi:diaminopimelate epimerase
MRAIPYAKFDAVGNTWIAIDAADLPLAVAANDVRHLGRLARSICDPQRGVGADGLLILSPSRRRANHFRVRFFNLDGSEAEMSGNGIRSAAAFAWQISRGRRSLRFETAAGVRTVATVKASRRRWTFQVSMGRPILDPKRIPFVAEDARPPILDFPLRTRSAELRVNVCSMGNPHCTLFVDRFEGLDWHALGRELERHPQFPSRTNVEFVRVASRRAIEVRFWERGVGPTASSGTGSSAAVVASVLSGRTARQVTVRTEAGPLQVSWIKSGAVRLVGPVRLGETGSH